MGPSTGGQEGGSTSGGPRLGVQGFDDPVEVGRGGFGVVYRARQADFDRTVAIKVLSGAFDEGARRRFERERRAMGSLSSHPYIVTVFGSGFTDDGRPYIVMEYLPGGSLADQIDHQDPLPWADAFALGVKLCDALEEAHRAGVLHRDIKPENILVSKYGEPKLADFGIARVMGGPETASGIITASISHSPPEVLDGHRPSAAADVYSLASTLHTLITGRLPFSKDTDESIVPMLARIATEPPPDLRARGVPDPAAVALETAMAKDPADRPGSAAELSRLLNEACQAPPAAGGHPPAGNRSDTTMRPTPRPAPPYAGVPSPTGPAGGGQRQRNTKVPLLVGAVVVAIAAVAGVTLLIAGGGPDGQAVTTTTSSTVASELPDPDASPAWTGDPELYSLGQQCFEGDVDACNSLYFAAPIDSADETYGATCGGRNEEVNGSCVVRELPGAAPPGVLGEDPTLNALAEGCFNGDPESCDSLYSDSAIDSAYETYGSTCGGRNEEVDGSCVERYDDG
jgi:predicted Ser/Thr protein kinase